MRKGGAAQKGGMIQLNGVVTMDDVDPFGECNIRKLRPVVCSSCSRLEKVKEVKNGQTTSG